jgi:hypothetical protein
VEGRVAGFYHEWFETLWDESGVGSDNRKIMKAVFERFQKLPAYDQGSDDDLAGLSLDGMAEL